jgi:hypothetical protein
MLKVLIIDWTLDVNSLSTELKKLYNTYISNREKSSHFNKIKHLLHKRPTIYVKRCREFCKNVKYVSFREDQMKFIVRPTYNKKRMELGAFSNFDEALQCLKEFIELVNEEEKCESVNQINN